MSYTRKYHASVSKYVTVHYTGSGSCSCGKTVNYSGSEGTNVDIPIDVNIKVDTDSFDRSVANCNNNVSQLTSAVVATQTAQVVSIDKNAKKVAGAIVKGFFNYIRSDISQQVMELSQRIDSQLLHLRELSKSCVSKQKQMKTDYNRISNRYLKIFDDLNNELENRIFELNKPAFLFKNNSNNHLERTSETDLVSTVAVLGLESGELQVKISASVTKKRAFDTINQTNIFLWKQKKLQSTINCSMLNENYSAIWFSPVGFMETNDEKSQINKKVFQSDFLPKLNRNEMVENLKKQNWKNVTKEQKDNVQRYFNSEVNSNYAFNDQHNNRVKETIVRIFDLNSMKSI